MKQFINILFTLILLLAFNFSHSQTLTMRKQAETIISKLKNNYEYSPGARDTLIDLNGDNCKDLLIEYYGESGTGLKNRIKVYLYDKSKKDFLLCKQLDYLANPSFYFDTKIVAGYYLANGGGNATKMKWDGLRLDTIEHINIDVITKANDVSFKLTAYNYLTKKKTIQTLPLMKLPDEYRYMDYEPIIKTNSN
jgi:hypothetical protein